jgi:hypothetical protein
MERKAIRSMCKLKNIKTEVKRFLERKDEGDLSSDSYRVIYTGDKNSNTGVGIILNKDWGQRVKSTCFAMTKSFLLNRKQTKMTWSLYKHTCQLLAKS